MSDLAINDKGEAMFFDPTSNAWQPAPLAENDRGERMALVGQEWRPLGPGKSMGGKIVDGLKDTASAVGDFVNRADDWRDTRLAKAFGGAAGLPRMAVEGADWASRKLGLTPDVEGATNPLAEALPTGQEAAAWLMPKGKRPDWQGGDLRDFQERSTTPIVDAGVEAMVSPIKAGGLKGPLINFGAGAGGETAGEIAHKYLPDWETPLRIFGSIVGGGSAAAVPTMVGKTAKIATAPLKPFTASGRDKIVGSALNDVSDDAPRAIAKMEAYEPPVPGFKITAAKASGDDSLMATENALNRAGAGFGERVNANNATLTSALDKLDAGMDPKAFVAELAQQDAGAAMRAQAALDMLPKGVDAETAGNAIRTALRGRYDTLKTARSEATEPLYDAARNDPTKMKPFPLLTSTADAVTNSKGELRTTAENVRKLLFDANGKADRSAAGMMATRDAINDMMSSASPAQQRMLHGFRDEVDRALEIVPPERLARNTYSEMSRPLDVFSAEKGFPFAESVIEKDRFGKNFMLPAEKVPTQFFKPGDSGAATMKEFLAANGGNASAIDSMKSFVADKARATVDVGAFLAKHGPAISTLDPQLVRQLEGATATRNISEGFKASPAAKFIGGDIDAAVRSTLNAPDSARRMQSLRMSVGGNPEAVQGLQKAILDDFRLQAMAKVAEDGSGNARLMPNGAEGWLRANRGAAANVLHPDQMAGLEAINRALKDQAQTAVKVAGSDTQRNLASKSIVDALLWKGAGDVAWLSPVRKALGLVYGGANDKALERMTEALLDPKVAAALMKKATPQNVRMAEPVLAKIAAAAAGASRLPEERGER